MIRRNLHLHHTENTTQHLKTRNILCRCGCTRALTLLNFESETPYLKNRVFPKHTCRQGRKKPSCPLVTISLSSFRPEDSSDATFVQGSPRGKRDARRSRSRFVHYGVWGGVDLYCRRLGIEWLWRWVSCQDGALLCCSSFGTLEMRCEISRAVHGDLISESLEKRIGLFSGTAPLSPMPG